MMPMSAGSWAFRILRKTIKKHFLKVFPMPTQNLQKTKKTIRGHRKFWKTLKKTFPRPLKTFKKPSPGDIFMSFGLQTPPKGGARAPFGYFSLSKPSQMCPGRLVWDFLKTFSRLSGAAGGFFETFLRLFRRHQKMAPKNCFEPFPENPDVPESARYAPS